MVTVFTEVRDKVMENGEKTLFTCVITALNQGKNQIRPQKNQKSQKSYQMVSKW